MGFQEVFQSVFALNPTGGGVTAGKEPWVAQPGQTTTVSRIPKPLITYGALDDQQAAQFLQTMGGVLARSLGDICFVRPEGAVVDPQSGVRWLPDFSQYNFSPCNFAKLSISLEDAGFDPTRCAVQVYQSVVGGISGLVHFPSQRQMAVRLLYGPIENPQVYEGTHDANLVLFNENGPRTFATEVKTLTAKGG